MNKPKKVLLIAGGGTLGTHTARNLLEMGCQVDVICLEPKKAYHHDLTFIQAEADLAFLETFLEGKHYDGIVNFIHYTTLGEYRPVHPILAAHTDHLIFLSSYRIYADRQHPITETAPRLLDVMTDPYYLETESYAIPKARCEDFLRNETDNAKWTIVRPVISFSVNRFDFIMGGNPVWSALKGEPMVMPDCCRYLTAGLDWAGNSGKIIANLLFKDKARGEAFTVSSAQGLTWDEVAALYHEQLGTEVKWVPLEEYFRLHPNFAPEANAQPAWQFCYDRLWSRDVDNSKMLAVTGLKPSDFLPIREAIRLECQLFAERIQPKKEK